MNTITRKPVILQVIRTWRLEMGMSYSVVEDVQGDVWVVESCPAGTYFWTVAQAAQLPHGRNTRAALRGAVELGRNRDAMRHLPYLPKFPTAVVEAPVCSTPVERRFPRQIVRTRVDTRNRRERELTLA